MRVPLLPSSTGIMWYLLIDCHIYSGDVGVAEINVNICGCMLPDSYHALALYKSYLLTYLLSAFLLFLCAAESSRPSTFPRGRCPVSSTSASSASAVTDCGCAVLESEADRSRQVPPSLSRSASSSSSGIGSMGLSENATARPSLIASSLNKCEYILLDVII